MAFVDIVVSQDSAEDDLIHVASHRILEQQVVGDFVDSHEHKSHLTCRLGSLLLIGISLDLLLDSLNLEGILHHVELLFLFLIVSFFQVSRLLLWAILELVQVDNVLEVGEGLGVVKVYIAKGLLHLLQLFLLVIELLVLNLLSTGLNLLNEVLKHVRGLCTSLVSFSELPEDLGQIELLQDDVDLLVNAKTLLIDELPLLDELSHLMVIKVVVFELLDLVTLLLRPNGANLLSHVPKVIGYLRTSQGSKEDPLVVVETIGTQVDGEARFGTVDRHANEEHFLLEQTSLRDVHVAQFPVPIQDLGHLDAELVRLGAHEVRGEVEVLQGVVSVQAIDDRPGLLQLQLAR